MKKRESRNLKIEIRVTSAEKHLIEENAKEAGLLTSEYLREVGQKIVPRSQFDKQAILDLIKINGDLGRLGGLLKLAITSDKAQDEIGRYKLNKLYHEMKHTKEIMGDKILKLKIRL